MDGIELDECDVRLIDWYKKKDQIGIDLDTSEKDVL